MNKPVLTATRAAAQGRRWAELRCRGAWRCWLEFDPADGATRLRGVKAHGGGEAGPSRLLTPAGFDLRSRVHEYGGGVYCLTETAAVFVNGADQGLYLQPLEGGAPRALYHHPGCRYGDLEYDPVFGRVLAVEEEHGGGGEAVNRLVAFSLGDGTRRVLAQGADFYASPRISPDGSHLAWIDWDHPHQPWLSTRLQRARLADSGMPLEQESLTLGAYAGTQEAVQQPVFGPDGALYFISDRTGWWNLYRYKEGSTRALLPREAEFGSAPWQLGLRSYCPLPGNRLALSLLVQGEFSLGVLALDSGRWQSLPGRWAACQSLAWDGDGLQLLADTAAAPAARLRVDPATLRVETRERLAFAAEEAPRDTLALPRSLVFESAGGQAVQGFFYAPAATAGPPPLLVQLHGGPTAMADCRFDLLKQYWIQRGYALLDLNYRGSSGFGRAFRHSLKEAWGVAEVEDLFHACRELIRRGWVDAGRIMIRGNSAGGFSVLRALSHPQAEKLGIRAGASHYGISDLALLARQTHKFESRYLQWLIGDPDRFRERYRSRSPIRSSDAVNRPVIFFQGGLDPVVPAVQTYRLYQQLRSRGVIVDYEAFSDERHGFRHAANRAQVLRREQAFYRALEQQPEEFDHVQSDR